MIPLDQLALGETAEIEMIETDELPLKLIEMGCLPGNSVCLIQIAPYNDPLYIKIDESYLGIGRQTAKNIFVRLIK
ncbi:MAG: ferrous iron transport protein A [Flavobacteriaceae bacterium TMED179]|nr:MAG: ferrous iron transport protein A [Flavobacteriaceae bacterium TMED179]|tara:strand:+ start:3709 stop:3936 length:228 start_codon:yes stop_codon:yes gene_type:complete